MPIPLAVSLGITGLSALAGLFGNRKKTSTQQQTQNQQYSNTQNVDLYDNPILSGEAQSGYSSAINALLNQMQQDPDLRGYTASGLRNISRQSDLSSKLLERTLAQRGLSNSPAYAAIMARNQDAQSGQTLDFLNSIPLLQRQFTNENAMNLVRAASAMPVGTRRTGSTTTSGSSTGTTTGTATQPGDRLGGLFSGLGQGIASTFGYNSALGDWQNQIGAGGVQGVPFSFGGQVPNLTQITAPVTSSLRPPFTYGTSPNNSLADLLRRIGL